ncbi:hypothetical protein HX798_26560 [Pseudomonas putida]|uniref:DNA-binding protein n=1 Tax=Pseudomonas putida TaxID=303 RepID=A0A7Y7ZHH1_PSEPU|nr:hypothetical protein [Pseudomonas putida]NWC83819.1 hypothetical protein [Pseudomonas putida]
MFTTLAHAGIAPAHHTGDGNAYNKQSTYDQLFSRFGDAIPRDDVADLLYLSKVYFAKRIGSKNLDHLAWVKALKPARFRRGRRTFFQTQAVVSYLDTRESQPSETTA